MFSMSFAYLRDQREETLLIQRKLFSGMHINNKKTLTREIKVQLTSMEV